MKALTILLAVCLLALAGCGGDDEEAAKPSTPTEAQATQPAPRPAAKPGTRIALGESDYGTMLFDSRKQAIYVFQNDSRRKTVCYGECADAWPPVYTDGAPRAGAGVKASLLGTITRRDGREQVTYAGKPLYFYANEGPGEVRCHNVNLNGGLWWVVGPDGKRRA